MTCVATHNAGAPDANSPPKMRDIGALRRTLGDLAPVLSDVPCTIPVPGRLREFATAPLHCLRPRKTRAAASRLFFEPSSEVVRQTRSLQPFPLKDKHPVTVEFRRKQTRLPNRPHVADGLASSPMQRPLAWAEKQRRQYRYQSPPTGDSRFIRLHNCPSGRPRLPSHGCRLNNPELPPRLTARPLRARPLACPWRPVEFPAIQAIAAPHSARRPGFRTYSPRR